MKLTLFTAFFLIQISAICSEPVETIIKGKINGVSTIYLIDLDCAYPYNDSIIEIPVNEQNKFYHSVKVNSPSIFRLYFHDNKNITQSEFLKGQAEHAEYLNYGLCDKFFTKSLDMLIYPGDTIQIGINNLDDYLEKCKKRKSPEIYIDSQKYSRNFFEKYRIKFSHTDIDDFKYQKFSANEVKAKLHKNNQKMYDYINSEKDDLNSRIYNYCKQEILLNELCWFYNISKYIYKDEQTRKDNGFYEVESDYTTSIDFNKFDYPVITSRQYQACLEYFICYKSGLDLKNFDVASTKKRIVIAEKELTGNIKLCYISKSLVNHIKLHSYSDEVDEIFEEYFMNFNSNPIVVDVKKQYLDWKKISA
jgi:hypothetical protein